MVDEDTEYAVTILVMKDRSSKAIGAHPVPCKGTEHPYPTMRLTVTLDERVRNRIVITSDEEPAIVGLKRAVKERRIEETVLEEAPRGDHQANGDAEPAVKAVAGKFRTCKAALEARIWGEDRLVKASAVMANRVRRNNSNQI